jgi:hypothetical protein
MKFATALLGQFKRSASSKEDFFDLRLRNMMAPVQRRQRVAFPGLFHFRRADV